MRMIIHTVKMPTLSKYIAPVGLLAQSLRLRISEEVLVERVVFFSNQA